MKSIWLLSHLRLFNLFVRDHIQGRGKPEGNQKKKTFRPFKQHTCTSSTPSTTKAFFPWKSCIHFILIWPYKWFVCANKDASFIKLWIIYLPFIVSLERSLTRHQRIPCVPVLFFLGIFTIPGVVHILTQSSLFEDPNVYYTFNFWKSQQFVCCSMFF